MGATAKPVTAARADITNIPTELAFIIPFPFLFIAP
jgi:hypothetical protein